MVTPDGNRKKTYRNVALKMEWIGVMFRDLTHVDGNTLREKNLLFRIASAESHGKLAIGIEEVLLALYRKGDKLLIAEKDYLFRATDKRQQLDVALTPKKEALKQEEESVDAVIERLLHDDGDLDFVENSMPKKYKRMVMILND